MVSKPSKLFTSTAVDKEAIFDLKVSTSSFFRQVDLSGIALLPARNMAISNQPQEQNVQSNAQCYI